jgi:hypothetical protein
MSQDSPAETQDPWAGSGPHLDRDLYVRCALACYRITPTTAGTADSQDRLEAAKIFEAGVSLELLQAAMILAAARRSFREATEPPLAPIRSIRYFLPLIEEIRTTPIEPDYIRYLEQNLLRLARSTPSTAS